MTEHYNKLTPAEAERLAWLIEECGEVIQAASKILRHGYDSTDPTNPDHAGNRADLSREMTDVVAAMFHMCNKNDIRELIFRDGMNSSRSGKKFRYMHHQDEE